MAVREFRDRNFRARLRAASALALAAGFVAGTPALAQTATSAPAAPAPVVPVPTADTPPEGGLQDIVVVAQKRAENLQNVPISISAVSNAAIENLHTSNIVGLQGAVPNVQIGHFSNTPATAAMSIRGIGVIDPDPYSGLTVSVVQDGVPQLFAIGALVDIYDLDHVEVLRGPQGTLFGANTTGGVINVISALPTHDFTAKAELTGGNYARFDAKAVVNAPLSDVLFARVAVSHSQHDGYVTNVVNGQDMGRQNTTLVRGTLQYEPSSDFHATLVGEYAFGRNGAPVVINGALPGELLYVAPGTKGMYASPCQSVTAPCKAPDEYYGANDSVPDRSHVDSYRVGLTLNWNNTAIGDITSITAYKKTSVDEFTDQDGTPIFLTDTDRYVHLHQFTQELRTNATLAPGVKLIVGGFFATDHYDLNNAYRIQFAGPGLIQEQHENQGNSSISGFAQTYVDITDKLRAQAGVRFTHEHTNMVASTVTSVSATGVSPFDAAGNTVLQTVAANGAKSWNNVGWKLGLDYKLDRLTLLYASWARGFKSGGFVGRIGLPSDIGPFNPEHVDTFEAGVKTDLMDHHLRINLGGFYTNYRNLQVAQIYVITDPATGLPVQGNTIVNAAKAEIKGFEAEVTAIPVSGLTLSGSLSYLDSRYKDFPYLDPVTLTTRQLAGMRLQNSPKWSASAGFDYVVHAGAHAFDLNMRYTYTGSKYFTAILDTPRSLIQPTHYLDGNLDWTLPGDRFTIGVWAKNIFDNRYMESVFDAPGYSGIATYADPRTFGITLKASLR